MAVTLYRASAFPSDGKGGNEAGVVLNADQLSDAAMLKIAARVNYSETAFVMASDQADFKVRFFTPLVEVPLCGHATIATFNLMRNIGIVSLGTYQVETGEGLLEVVVESTKVWLALSPPTFGETVPADSLEQLLGIEKSAFSSMPAQVVSCGIPEIFVGVKNRDILHALKPSEDAIKALCKKFGAYGVYVFTQDTIDASSHAHGRNFIPVVGIYEESATGTASGALACYLQKTLTPDQETYYFEQGHVLHKPSCITVNLRVKQGTVDYVNVGGKMRFIDKIIGFNPNA